MKHGFILLFLLCVISNTYASTDCLQRPSCAELGYTQTRTQCSCFEKDVLPCPFNIKDDNTVFCGDLDYADLSDSVTLTDNVDELVAQGYTKVTQSTTIDEFKKLLNTNNAKIVLAEDVVFNSSFTFRGSSVIINGGGHVLKTDGLFANADSVTFENIVLKNRATEELFAHSIYSNGKNMSLRQVVIIQNDNKDYCRALRLEGTNAVIENVSIYMSSQIADELDAIWVTKSAKIRNVRINLSGGVDTVLAGIVTHTDNVSIANVGMIAGGGKNIYGVVGLVDGVKTASVGGSGLRPDGLYNGQANTKAVVAQLGEKALAAYAAMQFYVGDMAGDFGQGKWYLPSIGEWMEFYGTNITQMIDGAGSTGANGDNKNLINAALNKLSAKGVEAEAFKNQYYWTSSENASSSSWRFNAGNGHRTTHFKNNYSSVIRLSLRLNLDLNGTMPKVGDVMYEDKTFGKAEDYDGSKRAVGVVAIVSEDGRDVTIINLKDLTFSSMNSVFSFNSENPYGGVTNFIMWCTKDKASEDISGVENFSDGKFLTTVNPDAPIVTVNGLKKSFTEPCD